MTKTQKSSHKDQQDNPTSVSSLHIIKTSSCRALSSNGEIGYEFSLDNKKALHIRITSNTGGGFFSDESTSIANIERILFSQPDPSRLTSVALQSLFRAKSVNTPAFLMAALAMRGSLNQSVN